MYEQVTLQVSDRVARHAAYMALQSQQRMEEILARWL